MASETLTLSLIRGSARNKVECASMLDEVWSKTVPNLGKADLTLPSDFKSGVGESFFVRIGTLTTCLMGPNAGEQLLILRMCIQ